MLNDRHLQAIEARGLSVETASAMGLYSARRSRDGSIEPDERGDILCFPFFERGEEVNTKYRWRQDGERRFMQRKGGAKTLFNADVLFDEDLLNDLETGTLSLIWTEGEFDCMAGIDSGYPTTVSVPDGAPPGRDKNGKLIEVPDGTDDIDPEDDDKFAFMPRLMEQIMRVRSHIIATDNDDSGRRMAKELVRRIGPARCYRIEWPEDQVVEDAKSGKLRACKDLNEVLLHLGADVVREMIDNAKPWPVKGLFKLSDYPDQEIPTMHEIGISKEFDEHFKIYAGAFIVATGVPNVGKSTLINQCFVQMAKVHKWPIAVFSGEKAVKPFLAQEFMTAFLGKARSEWSFEERKQAERFVERYFSFIDHDPRLDDGEDIDLDFLLDRAAAAVFRYGIKGLLLDPWNELEHKRPGQQSLTEYTGDAIRKLKRFAKSFDCAVCVVAHPTKMDSGQAPGLYNISDSAHWANKADLGVVVHADDPTDSKRDITIPKVRLKGTAGKVGTFPLDFDERTYLFKAPAF